MKPVFRSHNDERRFLEGPGTRKSELSFIFRIARDLFSGIRALHLVGPCITVFGSARMGEEHPYYDLARRMGASLAELGYEVLNFCIQDSPRRAHSIATASSPTCGAIADARGEKMVRSAPRSLIRRNWFASIVSRISASLISG